RQQDEDAEAKRQRVRVQRRHRRNQRRHARGNADRDVEDIVDHDARGRQKAGVHAEVFLGDRVSAAADRIGFDGLPVGDEQDRQQSEDDQHSSLRASFWIRELPYILVFILTILGVAYTS